MTHGHVFWFILIWTCVVWYCTTTIYVAIQGGIDIKEMLRRLRGKQNEKPTSTKQE